MGGASEREFGSRCPTIPHSPSAPVFAQTCFIDYSFCFNPLLLPHHPPPSLYPFLEASSLPLTQGDGSGPRIKEPTRPPPSRRPCLRGGDFKF